MAESLAAYYAENPAVTFRVAWAAYTNDYLPLAEAAAAIGGTFKQFMELGRNYTYKQVADIPEELLSIASEDEKFLLQCLPDRMVNILEHLLEKDILMPTSQRYIGSLWEDLRLLKKLHLVVELDRNGLYQYSIGLINYPKETEL